MNNTKNFSKQLSRTKYHGKKKMLNDNHNGISPEQDWNMSEKSLQMGGGCKHNAQRYFFVYNCKEW